MRLTKEEERILISVLKKIEEYECEKFFSTELIEIPDLEYRIESTLARYETRQKRINFLHKAAIAAIVAISLLLTSCAAYVFREEIAGLWISLFDDHMHVEGAGDSEITEIETVYLPTYIPEGHILKIDENDSTRVYKLWERDNTRVSYRQDLINASSIVDSENAYYEVIELGGYTVHKLIKDGVIQLIWRQEDYVFCIATTNLGYEETLKIFESIERIDTSSSEE